MPDIDFWDFFRYLLGTIATIYATVVIAQSLWGWYVFLTGPDKYTTLLRRYVIVQGLRLRIKAFWADVALCILLSIAFLLICWLHGFVRAGLV